MAAHAPTTLRDAVASRLKARSTSRSASRSDPRFARLLGVASVTWIAGACSPSPPAAGGGDSTTGERVVEVREQELTKAHRRALAEVVDAAGPVLADDDPLQRAIAAAGPPGVPPVPRARDASPATPALREARDIDVSRLEQLDAQLLLGLRFGLERADLHVRRPRAPYDPSWALVELGALLDELLHRRLTGSGDASAEGTALREAGLALFGSLRLLRRTSPAGLRGALALVDENRAKLDALTRIHEAIPGTGPGDDPARLGIESLRGELDRSSADLQRRQDGVKDLEELPWRELWDARSPLEQRRLGDVVDPTVTRRFLSVEERLDLSPRELLGRLRGNLARLAAMDSIAARTEVSPSPALPLTVARCEDARRDLAAAVSRHPEASAASEVAREGLAAVSCEALAASGGPRPVDDARLRADLLLHGVVLPGRRATMRRQPEVLRMLAGQMAPRAHRWVLLIGHAHALEAFDVERLAIAWARRDACLASAAVLAHARPTTRPARPTEPRAEVPVHTEQSARAWLMDACPELDVDALTDEARTLPWRSLEGGGLALLDDQPYVMAGLDEFWWLPLGLVVPFAVPDPEARLSAEPRAAPSGPRPAEVTVQVEEL